MRELEPKDNDTSSSNAEKSEKADIQTTKSDTLGSGTDSDSNSEKREKHKMELFVSPKSGKFRLTEGLRENYHISPTRSLIVGVEKISCSSPVTVTDKSTRAKVENDCVRISADSECSEKMNTCEKSECSEKIIPGEKSGYSEKVDSCENSECSEKISPVEKSEYYEKIDQCEKSQSQVCESTASADKMHCTDGEIFEKSRTAVNHPNVTLQPKILPHEAEKQDTGQTDVELIVDSSSAEENDATLPKTRSISDIYDIVQNSSNQDSISPETSRISDIFDTVQESPNHKDSSSQSEESPAVHTDSNSFPLEICDDHVVENTCGDIYGSCDGLAVIRENYGLCDTTGMESTISESDDIIPKDIPCTQDHVEKIGASRD